MVPAPPAVSALVVPAESSVRTVSVHIAEVSGAAAY